MLLRSTEMQASILVSSLLLNISYGPMCFSMSFFSILEREDFFDRKLDFGDFDLGDERVLDRLRLSSVVLASTLRVYTVAALNRPISMLIKESLLSFNSGGSSNDYLFELL